MIKIEKNIPIPKELKRPSFRKYPLSDLEVEDSFFIPAPSDEEYQRMRNIIQSIIRNKKFPEGKKFVIRKVEEGLRCWRIQ
jgi:hypothetical protein